MRETLWMVMERWMVIEELSSGLFLYMYIHAHINICAHSHVNTHIFKRMVCLGSQLV